MVDIGDDTPKRLLAQLKHEARVHDEDTFTRRHAGWWLLGYIPRERDDDDDEWSFATDVRAIDSRGLATPGRSMPPGDAERLLWRIEKTDRNTWKSRISVGRATNNDIVIRHDSVSKLHAHFHQGALARLKLSDGLLLADVGSANGTTLDGRPLPVDDTVTVKSGAHIEFGNIHCELFDVKALFKRLRMML